MSHLLYALSYILTQQFLADRALVGSPACNDPTYRRLDAEHGLGIAQKCQQARDRLGQHVVEETFLVPAIALGLAGIFLLATLYHKQPPQPPPPQSPVLFNEAPLLQLQARSLRSSHAHLPPQFPEEEPMETANEAEISDEDVGSAGTLTPSAT